MVGVEMLCTRPNVPTRLSPGDATIGDGQSRGMFAEGIARAVDVGSGMVFDDNAEGEMERRVEQVPKP